MRVRGRAGVRAGVRVRGRVRVRVRVRAGATLGSWSGRVGLGLEHVDLVVGLRGEDGLVEAHLVRVSG